jgi:hypothetical protein
MIRYAPLAGGGPATTLYPPSTSSTQGASLVSALAVLRPPLGAGPPAISSAVRSLDEGPPPPWPPPDWGFGGAHTGQLGRKLSCSPGTWAPDQPGFHLYQAPRSFVYQWRLDGTDIGGATGDEYTASTPGSYTCRVTASNRAGSATQTSAAVRVSP